jgi:hypothetical protein
MPATCEKSTKKCFSLWHSGITLAKVKGSSPAIGTLRKNGQKCLSPLPSGRTFASSTLGQGFRPHCWQQEKKVKKVLVHGTVIDHLPHHPKVKRLSPTTFTLEQMANGYLVLGTVVEHLPYHPKVKGLSPTTGILKKIAERYFPPKLKKTKTRRVSIGFLSNPRGKNRKTENPRFGFN